MGKVRVTKMRCDYDCGWATVATILAALGKPTRGLRDELNVDGQYGLKSWLPEWAAQGTMPWDLSSALKERGFKVRKVIGDAAVRRAGAKNFVAGLCDVDWNPHWVALGPPDELYEVLDGTTYDIATSEYDFYFGYVVTP